MSEKSYQLNIILIGSIYVGKTSLLIRYVESIYEQNYLNTLGIDFRIKQQVIEGKKVKLIFWDSPGQERYRNITRQYYQRADGVIYVYDITERQSFEDILFWVNQTEENAKLNLPSVLIGNKCDLDNLRVVQESKGQQLAEQLKIPFFETSAKNNQNVESAFQTSTENVFQEIFGNKNLSEISQNELNYTKNIQLMKNQNKNLIQRCCSL